MRLPHLRQVMRRGLPLLVLVPIGMLYLSGFLGMLWWPPPSLAAYSTIIKITGIPGPEGGLIRVVCALSALFGVVMPWRPVRVLLYIPALTSVLLIVLSFMDTGQGFAVGAWSVGAICACIGLVCDASD